MSKFSYRNYLIPSVFAFTIFNLALQQGNAPSIYRPKPFEILFGFLLLFVLLDFLTSAEDRSLLRGLKSTWTRYSIILGALLISIFVGSTSTFSGWVEQAHWVYLGYASIAFAFLVFLASIYFVVRYKMALPWGLVAMATSPLMFYAALNSQFHGFLVGNARLIGVQNDPNLTAIYIGTGILLSSAFFLYGKLRLRLLGGLNVALLIPLFLWAGSRGAALAVSMTFVVLATFYIFQERSPRRTKAMLALACIIFFSVAVASFVLPQDARVSAYSRFLEPVLASDAIREFVSDGWVFRGDGDQQITLLEDETLDNFSTSRGHLWASAIKKSAAFPFGLGPAYHTWSPVERNVGPHNAWLDVLLAAGWGGFLLWMVFMFLVFREVVSIAREQTLIGVALFAELVFLLLSVTFIDAFTLKLLWLIMGMIVGYSILEKNEKPKNISPSADV